MANGKGSGFVDSPSGTIGTSARQALGQLGKILLSGPTADTVSAVRAGNESFVEDLRAADERGGLAAALAAPGLRREEELFAPLGRALDESQLGQFLTRLGNEAQEAREDLNFPLTAEMALGALTDPLSLFTGGASKLAALAPDIAARAPDIAALVAMGPRKARLGDRSNRADFPLKVSDPNTGDIIETTLETTNQFHRGGNTVRISRVGDVENLRTIPGATGGSRQSATTGTLGAAGLSQVMKNLRDEFPDMKYVDFGRVGGLDSARKAIAVDFTGKSPRAVYMDPRNPKEMERLIKYRQNREVGLLGTNQVEFPTRDHLPQGPSVSEEALDFDTSNVLEAATRDVRELSLVYQENPAAGAPNLDDALERAIQRTEFINERKFNPRDRERVQRAGKITATSRSATTPTPQEPGSLESYKSAK